jgi:hypothetical protein
MDSITIIIDAGITIFALGLFLISLMSYRKYKNGKLLIISSVFFIFLIKGLLLSFSLFFSEFSEIFSSPLYGLFDLVILFLLFIATLKR